MGRDGVATRDANFIRLSKQTPLRRGLFFEANRSATSEGGFSAPHYLLMVNFPKSTPRFQPLPVPLNASDTLPLVITVAREDAAAPA